MTAPATATPEKWWGSDGKPLPEVLATCPVFAAFWAELEKNRLTQIAFMYELRARLRPNPSLEASELAARAHEVAREQRPWEELPPVDTSKRVLSVAERWQRLTNAAEARRTAEQAWREAWQSAWSDDPEIMWTLAWHIARRAGHELTPEWQAAWRAAWEHDANSVWAAIWDTPPVFHPPYPFRARTDDGDGADGPEYPLGAPFHLLSKGQFEAIWKSCRELLEYPRKGRNAVNPPAALFIEGDAPETQSKVRWTRVVDSALVADSRLARFSINLNCSDAEILRAVRLRSGALRLRAGGLRGVQRIIADLRREYGTPVKNGGTGSAYKEKRNDRPWALVDCLDEYRRIRGSRAESLLESHRRNVVRAQETYARFLDLFEEEYGDFGWETAWEAVLRRGA